MYFVIHVRVLYNVVHSSVHTVIAYMYARVARARENIRLRHIGVAYSAV